MSKYGQRVLTEESARWAVGWFRADCTELLELVARSVVSKGWVYSPDFDVVAHPWGQEDVFLVSAYLLQLVPYPALLDPKFKLVSWAWYRDNVDKGFKGTMWWTERLIAREGTWFDFPMWAALMARLGTETLAQDKARKRGTWKAPGSANRMNIRVPHD